MTIQESLKELFYSLGGDADNVRGLDDPAEIIEQITALENGKESPIMVVTIKKSGSDYVADKTLTEVLATLSAAKPVIFIDTANKITTSVANWGSTSVGFKGITLSLQGKIIVWSYAWNSSGISETRYTLEPTS